MNTKFRQACMMSQSQVGDELIEIIQYVVTHVVHDSEHMRVTIVLGKHAQGSLAIKESHLSTH